MKKKNVLIGCESSGAVREAFRRRGHNAWSCDLLPADDNSPFHIQGNVLDIIEGSRQQAAGSRLAWLHPYPWEWDLLICHPPCTYLCVSGIHWNTRGAIVDGRPRAELTEEAVEFARSLILCHIPEKCMENPVGILSTRLGEATQYIQPYEFGHDASKKTGLWLVNLPPLVIDPAQRFPGRFVEWEGKMVERWDNQTDSGQNKLPP